MGRIRSAAHTMQWFLVFAALFILLPSAAHAARINDVWVTHVMPGQERETPSFAKLPEDAIRWWYSKKDRTYFLFLPAGSDSTNLRLWFDTSAESITVDGKTVHSGDQVDFLVPGVQVTLTCGENTYTLAVMQSINVPALFLSTESGSLDSIHASKENQEPGSLVLINNDGSLGYDGKLTQVKGRGNSTFPLNKKPYQIKLEKSTDLCGMGKSKTWILLAEYRDNSLLRNKIVFDLADALGLDYSSQSQITDVYINNDYYGSYLLCEKVEIGSSRVDINNLEKATEELNDQELVNFKKFGNKKAVEQSVKGYEIPNNPQDITGGYLVELEKPMRYPSEVSGFVTKRGQPVVIKEPEYASREQVEYIKNFFQGFENAIFAKDGIDPDSGKHYSEFVDMDSLVKKYLIEEVVKNFDGNTSSRFFYKPADEQSLKAFAGPVWDYDITLGNYSTPNSKKFKLPEYFAINCDGGTDYYWFPALYRQPDFYAAVLKSYREQFVPALETLLGKGENADGSLRSLNDYVAEISGSAAMNFARWPVFNMASREVKTGANYQENIDFIKNYLKRRMEFLAENWITDTP
jgi:hypothetical protein